MKVDLLCLPATDHQMPGHFELIERKGRGHPDTLSERLAEELSRRYSGLTQDRFGTILRHQFDKLALMGGRCDVRFGGGTFRSPIRLLINGRVSARLGAQHLAFRDMLFEVAQQFLEAELRNFDFASDCRVLLETSSNQTRGVLLGEAAGESPVHFRFKPRTLADIPEHIRPLANDTSLGCAWAPYSALEQLVLDIERRLTSDSSRGQSPWIGSDVKIMATRADRAVSLTVSVPQVSSEVRSAHEYRANVDTIRGIILKEAETLLGVSDVSLSVNPGDAVDQELLYMKLTGSSIESGDEGVVGRGNRIGGLISSCRPYTMEGLAGKNPAYHAGKIYSAAAWEIANKIWTTLGVPAEVFVASQMDRPLDDPWLTSVKCFGEVPQAAVQSLVEEVVSDIRGITTKLLAGKYPLV